MNKAIVDNKRAASQELAHYRRQKIKKQINHAGSPGPGPPTTLRYVPPFHGLLSDKLRIGPAQCDTKYARSRRARRMEREYPMQILINSDKNIAMHAALSTSIEAELHRLLDRFDGDLTRIEVFLTDENAAKSGPHDKRCILQARPNNHQSLTVTDDSADVQTAVSGAAKKMQRLLETTFGRIANKR